MKRRQLRRMQARYRRSQRRAYVRKQGMHNRCWIMVYPRKTMTLDALLRLKFSGEWVPDSRPMSVQIEEAWDRYMFRLRHGGE